MMVFDHFVPGTHISSQQKSVPSLEPRSETSFLHWTNGPRKEMAVNQKYSYFDELR